MTEFLIIGGGLSGLTLGGILAQRGSAVTILEPSPRSGAGPDHRSINLALSARGLAAVSSLGAMARLRPQLVAMYDRCIHFVGAPPQHQPYDLAGVRAIFSVSRRALWEALCEAALSAGARIEWGSRSEGVDLDARCVIAAGPDGVRRRIAYHALIGADGVHSSVRRAMEAQRGAHAEIHALTHGYCEIAISKEDAASLGRNSLHVWPRSDWLLVALPNPDGSFTGTLFSPRAEGAAVTGGALGRAEDVLRVFPDFASEYPVAARQAAERSPLPLKIVDCDRWCEPDGVLLIGDAAHAMAPYLGQGANCALEDCAVLAALLSEAKTPEAAFLRFAASRRRDVEAIVQMSLDNRHELSVDVASNEYRLRREVERRLRERFPGRFMSLYEMIAFTTIPYAQARSTCVAHASIIATLVAGCIRIEDVDMNRAGALLGTLESRVDVAC